MAPSNITDLPFELLDAVCEPIDHVRTLSNLSQTCSTMHTYIQQRGWSNFLRDRLYIKDPHIRDTRPTEALKNLTSLSRDLCRRSFHARVLTEPQDGGHGRHQGVDPFPAYEAQPGPFNAHRTQSSTNHPHYRHRDRQSMGYVPKIDSYECVGARWASRKQVVAWGAGSRLHIQQAFTGKEAAGMSTNLSRSELEKLDDERSYHRCSAYDKEGAKQGVDDITSLNLLSPSYQSTSHEHLFVGRASGSIGKITLDPTSQQWDERPYTTQGSQVRCTSVNHFGDRMLLSAGFGDQTVSIYDADTDHTGSALSTLGPLDASIWSCSLASNHLAIGCGPSTDPAKIFEVRPHGISSEPLRTFSTALKHLSPDGRHRSVNAIIPSTHAPMLGGHPGDLYFAGYNNGDCLLLDTRSHAEFVAKYADPIDMSTIYSLAVMGGQWLLAGAARGGAIKIFDLRMPGRTSYSFDGGSNVKEHDLLPFEAKGDYSLYMSSGPLQRGRTGWRPTRVSSSAIYSLSVPSPMSTTMYVGLEGRVDRLDAISDSASIEKLMELRLSQGPTGPLVSPVTTSRPPSHQNTMILRMLDHDTARLYNQRVGHLERGLPVIDRSWYLQTNSDHRSIWGSS